jgi:hypothetical protein
MLASASAATLVALSVQMHARQTRQNEYQPHWIFSFDQPCGRYGEWRFEALAPSYR